MELNYCVCSRDVNHEFACILHLTKDAKSRMIEPEYYEKYTPHHIPQGNHYEMELTTPFQKRFPASLLHYHINPHTQKVFVCWTGELQKLRHAQIVFRMWCLGATYAMLFKQSYDDLYKGDTSQFESLMRKKYGIGPVNERTIYPLKYIRRRSPQ